MKKVEIYISFILLSIAFVILLATLYPYRQTNVSNSTLTETPGIVEPTPRSSPVVILSPDISKPLLSPQKIIGLIDKSWVFEGSFPLELFDNQDKIIYQGKASAPNWIEDTDKFTTFTANLVFKTTSKSGFLKIKNDNPSGLPQNNKSLIIPIIYEK
ncbi:MAG: Gmad2 immunoglobulin-like domain-containing protein [Candidatus Shapirobacteria bacterium]